MLLETIHEPADLRDLDPQELDELAGEIRDFIVAAVAENSGHLGSNLGAVELTLALHRVFDSPRDAILWDTGHQAYVHKIVTGRPAGFEQLRQAGGLSGYPSREESEHDFVENSHASTILSYAYGLAVARDSGADVSRRHIVAVIGDGSMTGGMAYEALNNLGHSDRNVIIVLNDNGRSYAPTVSKLSNSLTPIRLNPVYMRRQRRMEDVPARPAARRPQAEKGLEAVKAAIREYFQPPAFFESLGVRYVGPVDGHDIDGARGGAAQRHRVRRADRHPRPHPEGPRATRRPRTTTRSTSTTRRCSIRAVGPPKAVPTGYTQAFAEAIIKEAEHESRLVAITAAMPGPTGLIPFQDRFPDRFFDVGIAEQHAVTAAAGMAMGGLRPVVAIYSTFLNRAWDQVVYDVALHRLPVLFCARPRRHHGRRRRVPPRRVRHGAAHQGAGHDGAGAVVGPGAAADAARRARARSTGPVAIRYPKGQARQVPDDEVGSGLEARRCARATAASASSPSASWSAHAGSGPRSCWPTRASTRRSGTCAAARRSTRR